VIERLAATRRTIDISRCNACLEAHARTNRQQILAPSRAIACRAAPAQSVRCLLLYDIVLRPLDLDDENDVFEPFELHVLRSSITAMLLALSTDVGAFACAWRAALRYWREPQLR
jgi:hypothetical protein